MGLQLIADPSKLLELTLLLLLLLLLVRCEPAVKLLLWHFPAAGPLWGRLVRAWNTAACDCALEG